MSQSGTNDPDITLYRLHGCPFCERVVRTLEELELPFRSRFVEAPHSERDVVKEVSGQREVPVLLDHEAGVTLNESARIVKYLHRNFRGAE